MTSFTHISVIMTLFANCKFQCIRDLHYRFRNTSIDLNLISRDVFIKRYDSYLIYLIKMHLRNEIARICELNHIVFGNIEYNLNNMKLLNVVLSEAPIDLKHICIESHNIILAFNADITKCISIMLRSINFYGEIPRTESLSDLIG